jgi:hypothetical protein
MPRPRNALLLSVALGCATGAFLVVWLTTWVVGPGDVWAAILAFAGLAVVDAGVVYWFTLGPLIGTRDGHERGSSGVEG